MKTILIVLALLFAKLAVCQLPNGYYESFYSVSMNSKAMPPEKKVVQALVMSELNYLVKSNDSLYSIEASGVDEQEGQHIQTTVSGPQKIYYNASEKLVLPDASKKDNLLRFAAVKFEAAGPDTMISNYKCRLYTSKGNDSLYISTGLPAFVNPFILDSRSINGAVILAITRNGIIYRLTKTARKEGQPFDKNIFPVNANIHSGRNMFF